MADESGLDGKKTRAKYFISGAIIGALIGAIIDQIILVSAMGMVAAVIIASRKEEQTR